MKAATKNDLGWLLLGVVLIAVGALVGYERAHDGLITVGLLFAGVAGFRLIRGLITAKDD